MIPEGTAGIINIVLNQQAELGLSGGLSAGTASTGQVNANGNIGKQQGKLTMFLSGSIYHDRRATSGTISRTNLVLPVPAFTETNLAGNQSPLSGGGTVRTEYRFTDRNTLSFDGFFYGGRFGGDQSSAYTDLDAARAVIGLFDQRTSQASQQSLARLRPDLPAVHAERTLRSSPWSSSIPTTTTPTTSTSRESSYRPMRRRRRRFRRSAIIRSANIRISTGRRTTRRNSARPPSWRADSRSLSARRPTTSTRRT